MASHRHSLVVAFSFLITLLLLVLAGGCQTQQMASNVPPPNFNGPVIVAAAPTSPMVLTRPAPAPTHEANVRTAANVPKDWIPFATPRPWKWIVVHHSATSAGSAAIFDKMHRDKGWDELGYDFVIGNGTNSGDGQIEVGPRWPKQKWGAHAKTPDNRYNEYGVGICLVGNFDVDRPTPAQIQSLARLCAYLMRTYHITPDNVIGHRETKPTDCPGRNMNIVALRMRVSQMLADSGESIDAPALANAVIPDAGVSNADATDEPSLLVPIKPPLTASLAGE